MKSEGLTASYIMLALWKTTQIKINALLQKSEIDIRICVELWFRNNMDDNFLLQKRCPFGFKFHSAPRLNKKGRGIGFF